MSTSAPRSREIAAELRRQIESGELPPGARVPSTRAIVDRWGVAMATATKVLTELRHQGLVRAVPGVGTVVEGDRRPTRAAPVPQRQGSADGALSAERIVAAGVAIADDEGLPAQGLEPQRARQACQDLATNAARRAARPPGPPQHGLEARPCPQPRRGPG